MYILDATDDLQAIASWGSLIVAIVSAIIAGIAIFQTNKIQELADIVTELKKSNETLEKRFSMEKLANLKHSMPVFQFDAAIENNAMNYTEIFIKNVGAPFQYINTNNQTKNIIEFFNYNTEGNSIIPPSIRVFFKDGEVRDNYEFDIITKSSTGHEHKQRYIKKQGIRPDITPPEY